jgi:hypothetical protein
VDWLASGAKVRRLAMTSAFAPGSIRRSTLGRRETGLWINYSDNLSVVGSILLTGEAAPIEPNIWRSSARTHIRRLPLYFGTCLQTTRLVKNLSWSHVVLSCDLCAGSSAGRSADLGGRAGS